MPVPAPIAPFVRAVLAGADPYDAFEEATDAVRGAILAYGDAASPEPVRSALRAIGDTHAIPALSAY